MITWTDSARDALDGYIATRVPPGGAEAGTLAAELRRRIDAELVAAGIGVATSEEVGRILARLGGGSAGSPSGPAPAPAATAGPGRRGPAWGGRIFYGFFGVVLPLITLGVEFFTGICAGFFDPIPTWWHAAVIVLVAAANAGALYLGTVSAPSPSSLRWLGRLNAFAMGIAVFYTLWLAVLIPFAVVAMIYFGIGLLPLAPLLSLVVAALLRNSLRQQARAAGWTLPRVWRGLLAGFLLLVALEVPGAFRAWATHTVTHGTGEEQVRALWLWRHAGGERELLRGCHGEGDAERAGLLQAVFGSTGPADRQLAYDRLTGRPFNSVPAPRRTLTPGGRGGAGDTQQWIWDDSLGDDRVGQRLKALYLTESRLDGTLDGDAALGYLEWTMVFRNDHEFQQREARALVQLPAGAVVSRLTLWIDGEEREAAFGGRGEVRQAYRAVVSQRRDPVLVTTKGPDRVLVQCFPIAPKGGVMKVRLGLTVPLALDQPGAARLALPQVIEQNFSARPGLSHAVWIEGKRPLASALAAYGADNSRPATHGLHGQLSPAQFASPEAGLSVARDPAEVSSWIPDPRDATRIFTQEIAWRAAAPGPLAVVVDGSRDLAAVGKVLADVLEKLPDDSTLAVTVAGDRSVTCPSHLPREVAAWLRTQPFAGGQDSAAALHSAFASLAARGGTLLWIHGVQPVGWNDTAALEQALARQAGQVRLLTFPAVAGANVLLEKLAASPDLVALPRLGRVDDDLARTFRHLHEGALTVTRQAALATGESPKGKVTSSHLARLWAADEVARLLAGSRPQREAAVRVAVNAQIVTAVTGAVVLETRQQYQAAGLDPVDPNTVPTVPDATSTAALLGALMLVMFCTRRINWHSLKMNAPAAAVGSQ